ncbi:hypothetical protein BHE74_00042222 [Ensete ventricosum]|nr:hypothetical protein GW17_00019741 [Ensete ventricosum]RWW51433.1 hypothetical protein BHE74_00042222 [Ensete ventricosum]RZR75956.1 hypothetical protein BHM03_00000541 [Ensete ventricosum]
MRCSGRQQQQQGGAAATKEGDGIAGSSCNSKQVRHQLRWRKAATMFLLARDAGSKEGRDNGCGERATVARWQGRQMEAIAREEGDEGAAGSSGRWMG